MSLIDIFNDGHKAYYDEVPRYKNPCLGFNSEYTFWEMGWDKASGEHSSFTENQQLKTDNQRLKERLQLESKLLQDISCVANKAFSYLDESNVFSFRREKIKSYLEKLRILLKKS